jgi:hypothetical protein
MLRRLLFVLAILTTFLPPCCIAATCYGYDGTAITDNQVCAGSNACCGATATCLSNRLCHNEGDNNGTFVRGPCAVQPYDPNTCAEICLYGIASPYLSKIALHITNFSADEVNGFFPRVNICDNGSYCCNDDVQCCSAGRGVFLDSTGAIVASPPSSTSSTMSTASSITSTSRVTSASSVTSASASTTLVSTTTSITTSPTNSQAQTSSSTASATASSSPATADTSSSLATGTKIGLGVGVPLGVLALGVLASTIWYQRRRIKIAEAQAQQGRDPTYYPPPNAQSAREWEMQQQHLIGVHELGQNKSPIMLSNYTAPVELSDR